MSAPDEHDSLLAYMAENPELSEGHDGDDDDPEAVMRATMGFSNFGGPKKPKRQPRGPESHKGFGTGANSQPVQQRAPPTAIIQSRNASALSGRAQPFLPASLPPRPMSSASSSVGPGQSFYSMDSAAPESQENIEASIPLVVLGQSTAASSSGALPHLVPTTDRGWGQDSDSIAYTHPVTQISFTRSELSAYERGMVTHVMDNDGNSRPVKVYFKPNFIEDDPWRGLEEKAR